MRLKKTTLLSIDWTLLRNTKFRKVYDINRLNLSRTHKVSQKLEETQK